MTPRESIVYFDARLRCLGLMLREALRNGVPSRYEIKEILRRVGGKVEAWFADPDNIRFREMVEIEDALVNESTGSVLTPREGIGRRPTPADWESLFSTGSDPEPTALPADLGTHLVDHDANVLGHTIRFLGQTPEERERLRDLAVRRIELAIGDRLPRDADSES